MFNASKTLGQMLASLAAQSYKNWRLILIDDASDKYEVIRHHEIINSWRNVIEPGWRSCGQALNAKVRVFWNDEKRWEVANVLHGISQASSDDIIVRLDADDYLCDADAFRIINEAYKQTGCDCLWTAHRWFDDDQITMQNISGPLPDGADPYVHAWVSSHLKTFRKRLLDGVKDENFRNADGEYFKRIGDQAVMLPALRNASKRIYLPLCTYAYRCSMKPETFQTDDAKFQRLEALILRARGYVA